MRKKEKENVVKDFPYWAKKLKVKDLVNDLNNQSQEFFKNKKGVK